MEGLPIDAVRVVASRASIHLRLACCNHHLYNLLAADIEESWTGDGKMVYWLRRDVFLRISINVPLTIRLVWNASNYTRELWVNLQSYDMIGNGGAWSEKLELYRCDVEWRWYSRRGFLLDRLSWPNIGTIRFTPDSIRVAVGRLRGSTMLLPHRRDTLSVKFKTQERLYCAMLQHV